MVALRAQGGFATRRATSPFKPAREGMALQRYHQLQVRVIIEMHQCCFSFFSYLGFLAIRSLQGRSRSLYHQSITSETFIVRAE